MPTITGLDPAPSGGLTGNELIAIDLVDGTTVHASVADLAALVVVQPISGLPVQSGGLQAEDLIAVDHGDGISYQYTLADVATFVGVAGGATNLGTSADATTVTVTSDTGTDATLVAATGSVAGVMSAADKTKLDTLDLPSNLSPQSGGVSGAEVVAVDDGSGNMRQVSLQEIADLAAPGGGGGTIGRHAVPVMAGAMRPSVTGGCAALVTIASAANQPDIQTLDFDATTAEFAQFSVIMPSSWNEGTVTFVPVWSHAATTTNFGVVWTLQAVAVSNDDAIATAFGTSQSSTDTGGTTNDLYFGPESSAITVAGTPAAGDVVFFRLSRDTASGSDTLAIDARLHGITLYITTDAETDA
jgi:hypothetical protein